MDIDRLTAWRLDIEISVRRLMPEFEHRFGYPPGRNMIEDPTAKSVAAARELGRHHACPPALPEFYRYIGEVVLADMEHAYFIHPAELVLRELTVAGPVALAGEDELLAVVFGSDGGGNLFAIDSGGAIHRSASASRDAPFTRVAADLGRFLDRLRREVVAFCTVILGDF